MVNQSGGNKEGVAEHALAMMLTLSKRIVEADRDLRAGKEISRGAFTGRELKDRNVGARVAELCRGLFNMRVLAFDPLLTAEQITARGGEKVDFDTLLRESFVSVHCPLTKDSRKIMNTRAFSLMRPEAYFITTAMGFIHDEDALAEALTQKKSPAPARMCGRKSRRHRPTR